MLALAMTDNDISGRPVLTPRQAQICDLIVNGLSSKEIGSRLSISNRTVDKLASTIMEKYGVRTRIQLTRIVSLSGAQE